MPIASSSVPVAAPAAVPAGTPRAAGARWLLAWASERFPLRNALFFGVLYVTALAVARAAVAGPAAFGPRDLPGFLALWAFFLVLRVMDEHKDFAADAVAHPGRALQRGLVTLGQLRVLAALAVALQLAVSVWRDGGLRAVTGWWLAALGWSLLMAREFFAPAWLRRRIVLYALTHMLVMPLLVAWVAAMGAPTAWRAPGVGAAAALAFVAGLAFEMARKLRAPTDERPTADSYTRALGVRGAVATLVAVLAAAGGAALLVVRLVAGGVALWAAGVVAVTTVAATLALLAFARAPSTAGARRAEGVVGLAVLAGHLVVLATLVAARGGRPV